MILYRWFFLICLLCFGFQTQAEVTDDIIPFKTVFHPVIEENRIGNFYQTEVKIDIPEDYYLYDEKLLPEVNGDIFKIERSEAAEEMDPYFGLVKIYDATHPAHISILSRKPLKQLKLSVQGCRENVICYPPDQWVLDVETGLPVNDKKKADPGQQLKGQKTYVTGASAVPSGNESQLFTKNRPKTNLSINEPGDSHPVNANPDTHIAANADVNHAKPAGNDGEAFADEKITQSLQASFWTALIGIFFLGALISFTACVYPMIPIVTTLVVGKNVSSKRSFLLTMSYVLGMASALAALGALFGIFKFNLQQYLLQPWAVALVALFFVLMAFSMFDFFTIKMPSKLQNYIDKIARTQQSGRFVGALVMGALSVLVVSPCATPVLAGLLAYVSTTSAGKGAFALFVFGLGMGLPLIIFATAFRHFMPKAGAWMDVIKKTLAFIMLAIAIWLCTRIIGDQFDWIRYAVWMLFALIVLVSLETLLQKKQDKPFFILKLARWLLIITVFGLAFSAIKTFNPSASGVQNTQTYQADFIESVNDANSLQSFVNQSDKPVIVDFYADWCTVCKVWERRIWKNIAFDDTFKKFNLIKIDVTNVTAAHQQLFDRLNIFGPPVVLVYKQKQDISEPNKKITGEMSAEEFKAVLQVF